MKSISALLLLAIMFSGYPSYAAEKNAESRAIESAMTLFENMTRYEKAYDSEAVGKLFDDSAKIKQTRIGRDGSIKTEEHTADEYRLRCQLFTTKIKAHGVWERYDDVEYKIVEGSRVKITATGVFSHVKFSEALTFIVGPDSAGEWKIFELFAEQKE